VAVQNVEIAMTNEGLDALVQLVATGVVAGITSTVDYKVGFFRLASSGTAARYAAMKEIRGTCTDIYYVKWTKAQWDAYFAALPTPDPNLTTYIAINSIEYIPPTDPTEIGSVEISCYVPPGQGSAFTCNEIMVYTGNSTIGYKSFLYGIFPDVTKQPEYGINLKITLEF